MKVAVKDANVLIDLVEGDLLGRRQAGQDILEIGVSGRSKPARSGQFKTSHLEVR
jgi:hypothetical protein